MIELRLALLVILSAPPYAIGFGCGLVARAGAWCWAAIKTGYYRGRGYELAS